MKPQIYKLLFIFIITIILAVGCKKEDSSTGPGPGDDNTPTNGIVVILKSTPDGSDIDIDGVATNQKTPFTVNWDNSKVGPHRFRIRNAFDRKIVDTSFYVFADKKYTINADNYLMWGGSWSGSVSIGQAEGSSYIYSWDKFFDTMVVPLITNARIKIYFSDGRCYPSQKAQLIIGNRSFEISTSPAIFSTSDILTRGLKGKPKIYGLYQLNCYPEYNIRCCGFNGITITNIILETF